MLLGQRYYGAGAPDADDLAQQVVLKLKGQEDAWQGRTDEDLLAYARRALHNLYIDKCHRKRREWLRRDATQDDVFDDDHNPEDLAIAREERRRQREALSDAVQLLDAQEREFLLATLRMSAAEAQRTLGYPPGSPTNAAHKRTHLLKKLRQAVAPKMADGAEEAS